MRKLFGILILLVFVSIGISGPVDDRPDLYSVLQSDNTLTTPKPMGWDVLDVERTETGVRFYQLVNGKLLWADYKFPLKVTVDNGVIPPSPNSYPVITSPLIASGVVGTSFTYTIKATGNPTSYGATGLLEGLLLDAAKGTIQGTPKAPGTSQLTVSATNQYGTGSAMVALTITGTTPPPPAPSKIRTLLLYPAAVDKLTEEQRQVVFSVQSGSVRDYCKQFAIDDGKTSIMAIAVENFSVDDLADYWKPLFNNANGKTGLEIQSLDGTIKHFDFPSNTQDALQKIKTITEPIALPGTINDSNYQKFLKVAGKSTGYIRGPPIVGMTSFTDEYKLIPRSQWKQLVKQGAGTFLSDLAKAAKIKVKDQDGTNYCWAYASTSSSEFIRALQGLPFVELSAESVGGPIKNWRNDGGWGFEALDQLSKVGACAQSFMNKPNSLSPSKWKKGWEEDCANHKIVASWATIDDGNFDAVFTAALLRMPVSIGLNWWSHQVLVCDPVVFDNGSYGVMCRNSWGDMPPDFPDGWFTLTESKTIPDGSFACISVSATDKEMNEKERGTIVDLVKLRQESVKKLIEKAKSDNYANAS